MFVDFPQHLMHMLHISALIIYIDLSCTFLDECQSYHRDSQ